ncbi:relaxase/mobilization nuclease domain-containing protein (plasmid) [Bradyrhizobium quebecense]|uniref:relaxase/mobilization nuclease domain-containing protein n=1 Tax=Bradyrhizobium quebecense TaxID=2748629 RepID=UPI001CD4DD60|nr:relaxase/mobilization nuclease domain-containing protein [Bradyrhizobium quebecense]UGA48967.1 relaxase/mobilization nuclease domain-containing protein [Bradyrhizobium quebecense]
MPHPQAIVRIVPRGGARTASQIRNQLQYLSRNGAVDLLRSERHQGVLLPYDRLEQFAQSWAEQTGNYHAGQSLADSNQDLTTHIIISFPPGTDANRAHAAGRAWTERMFGSGNNGGSFDYVTTFHVDRQHPHLHVVVNRRAQEGHWLKISRRNPHHNYDNMRAVLVDAAYDHGIELDATRRADRGIMERPITYAEFRRRQRVREAVAIQPEPEPDIPVSPRGQPEPPNLERDGRTSEALQSVRGVGQAIQASTSTAEVVARANTGAIVQGIEAQATDPGPSDTSGVEFQRETGRRRGREPEGGDGQPISLERPRQRRRVPPSNIETRAQRAAREQREAEEDAVDNVRAIEAQATDPGPSDMSGVELQRETGRRRGREPEGGDGQPISLERPRQRRRFPPSNIETRAQRAAREQREAEERARRHRRREPEPEDLDPDQPLRLRSGRAIVPEERGSS